MVLRGWFVAVMGLVLVAFGAFSEEPAETDGARDPLTEAVEFALEDQFREEHEIEFPSERVTFLILADRKGSDEVEGWIRAIYERYEDEVAIAGVAKLKGVPGLLQGMVRKLFKKGVDYPVMMDWEGEVCEAYRYEAKQANVFVIDTDGSIVLTLVGPSEAGNVETVCAAIDGLLGDGGATVAKSDVREPGLDGGSGIE